MTPRLVLLTGPEAGEVSKVFNFLVHGAESAEVRLWDEVRDYFRRLDGICVELAWRAPGDFAGLTREQMLEAARVLDSSIRSLPGGEAWLVGLVLPEPIAQGRRCITCGRSSGQFRWDCFQCLERFKCPARLAILAPEPPPLLVERVRAWGGEELYCYDCARELDPGDPDHCCIRVGGQDGWRCYFPTWPEAVRAALGEVAP